MTYKRFDPDHKEISKRDQYIENVLKKAHRGNVEGYSPDGYKQYPGKSDDFSFRETIRWIKTFPYRW